MGKICRNCCKIFCFERDKVTNCNKKITFVTQMLRKIDRKAGVKNG